MSTGQPAQPRPQSGAQSSQGEWRSRSQRTNNNQWANHGNQGGAAAASGGVRRGGHSTYYSRRGEDSQGRGGGGHHRRGGRNNRRGANRKGPPGFDADNKASTQAGQQGRSANSRGGHQRGGRRRNDRASYETLAGSQAGMGGLAPEFIAQIEAAAAREEAAFQAHTKQQQEATHQTSATTQDNADWKERLAIPEKDGRVTTEDVRGLRDLEFDDFHVSRALLMGIFEMGYERPSPVQEETIPFALLGRHILARAKNGTGKTAAFAIPTLELVNPSLPYTQAIVLVPTRELALQTSAVLKQLGKHLTGLNIVVVMGGPQLAEDIVRLMEPVHIIVATPGRLTELCKKRVARINHVNTFVCDEADKLLEPGGSLDCVNAVLACTPATRQIMLFSATFPLSVMHFRDQWMTEPHEVNLMEELTLKGVSQFYAYVDEKQKVQCLRTLFAKLDINQAIIFCNTISRVELLAQKITQFGSSCFYIHSRMDQEDRNRVFHEFRQGACRNLVSSDLFTRGIDIQSVNVVINFDMPTSSETYLHRIGRSGRFGHRGIAINFLTMANRADLYKIEQELGTEIRPIPPEIDKALYCV